MKREYPETYLHVYENATGEEWIQEIKSNWVLDLRARIQHFLRTEFAGEVKLDGGLDPTCSGGNYTATIYTDHREPDCGVCWDSAGFWVVATY